MKKTSLQDIRRSGRQRNKGPVICENTPETAIDADMEDSDDDFQNTNVSSTKDENAKKEVERETGAVGKRKKDVKGVEAENVLKRKRKKIETSKGESSSTYTFQTRTSPKKLFNAIETLTPVQKMCLERIGFGGLLDFKLDGIPNKIGYYVVDNFNPESMVIKVGKDGITITKDLIGELLGLRNVGRDIMGENTEKDEEMISSWNGQYNKKEVLTGDVKAMIRKSKVADLHFKLNFIVLFANIMGGAKGKAICELSILDRIRSDTDLSSINWCDVIWRGLKSCKKGWKNNMTNSYFLGPLTVLTMAYVDGVVCENFYVPRIRPSTKFWTFELLKEREKAESEGIGLGMGAKQGPYVEEDVDPMPDDEEGFVWKLSKVLDGIRTARASFEKTLEAGLEMFPGNMLIADLNQQYREALGIQKTDEGVEKGGNVDRMEVPKGNGGEDREKGHADEGINAANIDPFDSPAFLIGPETQLEVNKSADMACEEFYAEKSQQATDRPSFSLGMSRDPIWATQKDSEGSGKKKANEDDVGVEGSKTGSGGDDQGSGPGDEGDVCVEGSKTGSGSVEQGSGAGDKGKAVMAVPISFVKPDVAREKRVCSKPGTMLSPFLSRVIDIDAKFTPEEKLLESYLLTTDNVDFNDVLFETVTGVKATFSQLLTLLGGQDIDCCVVDAWSAYLNWMEQFKDPASLSRVCLPTFKVDNKDWGSEFRAGCAVVGYFGTVSLMGAREGKPLMMTEEDIVFIPVSHGAHKFVVCFNLKKPAVVVFDNKKVHDPTNSDCMRVATILQRRFGILMKNRNHAKSDEFTKSVVNIGEFHWQTDKKPNESGVFVMRHMEDYMGMNIQRWDCGLEDEGRKQTTQLAKLRKKYTARLLLSDCNTLKNKIDVDLKNYRAANAKVKKNKVPIRGV